METIGTLTTVLLIVFSILNVILFVKFWIMTDNVKRILNIMEKSISKDEMDEEAITEQKSVNMLPTIIILAIILILFLLFFISM